MPSVLLLLLQLLRLQDGPFFVAGLLDGFGIERRAASPTVYLPAAKRKKTDANLRLISEKLMIHTLLD
jgi:hypothetical protein